MKWPWNRGVDLPPPPVVDSQVAERLEMVAARLEEVAAALAVRVEEYRADQEEEEADAGGERGADPAREGDRGVAS